MDLANDKAGDIHRPRYHFVPPRNWMNDPNGLIHYKGNYHLFYQHNPGGPLWGDMHWGHAISPDLIHWRHMPIALAPDPDGPDADGCFSGAMVIHDGVPTIVYTGVRGSDELPCLAISEDDDLSTWTKYPGNPVIAATPDHLKTTIFRDHTLWRDGDAWMMGIGSGIVGEGGAVLLYRSTDLIRWDFLHPLVVEQPSLHPSGAIVSTGWECPDFFFLENEPALIACEWDVDPISTSYWTGMYRDQRFQPTLRGVVDAGPTYYAPQSFRDESGRRIIFGWLRERRAPEALVEAGWAGAMSLPREITRRADGTLAFSPVQEILALRGKHIEMPIQEGDIDSQGLSPNACEIVVRTDDTPDSPIRVEVLRSPSGDETTVVTYDPGNLTLSIDTRNASSNARAIGEFAITSVHETSTGAMDLRIFVDHSVVEVYLHDGSCLSARAYPDSPAAGKIRVEGAGATTGQIQIWEMRDAFGQVTV